MYLNDRSLRAARSVVFSLHNDMSAGAQKNFIWCMPFLARTNVLNASKFFRCAACL